MPMINKVESPTIPEHKLHRMLMMMTIITTAQSSHKQPMVVQSKLPTGSAKS
jgi:hypothetical protein